MTSSRRPAASVPSGAAKVHIADAADVLADADEAVDVGDEAGRAHLRDLALGVLEPRQQRVDALGQLLRPGLDDLGELGDEHVLAGEEAVGVDADERLDPAHAGADRGLAQELHEAELAGAVRVRAAAELARPVADRDDAHAVAVLLAEQRHRADRAGLRPGVMISAWTARSSSEHVVDPRLDVGQDRRRAPPCGSGKSKRRRPGEFSEPIWVAVSPSASRNALCTMWVAVWAREIARRRSRSTAAERCCPTLDLAGHDPAAVDDEAGHRRLHVEDLERRCRRRA